MLKEDFGFGAIVSEEEVRASFFDIPRRPVAVDPYDNSSYGYEDTEATESFEAQGYSVFSI